MENNPNIDPHPPMKSPILSAVTTRTLALAVLTLCGSQALADTIKTRDGKTWEGTIVAEDATNVTIKYMLTPTIPDTKVIPRSSIVSIEKKTPEDLEAEAVKKLLPTDDFLLPSAYQKLINEGPAKFLAAHPVSKHKADIEAVKKTLEEEMDKSRRGQRKVDGKWLNGREIQANEYNISAMRTFKAMEKLAAADRYRDALNEFVKVEGSGKLSLYYPKAIELARSVLEKYAASIAADIKSLPQKMKEADENLGKMVPDEVRKAKAERERQKREFAAVIAEEKKQKIPFTSVNDMELNSLNEAAKQVDTATKRLAAIDVAALTETAQRYDRVLQLIGQEKYEEASVRLEEFVKNVKTAAADPQVKRQVDELRKLREESRRLERQNELLNRTQSKPVDTTKPTGTPAPK
jgi:hypothetical protein